MIYFIAFSMDSMVGQISNIRLLCQAFSFHLFLFILFKCHFQSQIPRVPFHKSYPFFILGQQVFIK